MGVGEWETARKITLKFLQKIPLIREFLLTDVEAAYEDVSET